MALRRPFWPKSSFNRLRIAHGQEAPWQCSSKPLRGQLPRQRHLATHGTHAATAPKQHHFAEFLPPRDRTELDDVLAAVQSQNPDQVYNAFLLWTDVLSNPSSPLHDAAVRQAQELPGPSFSEILRILDPMRSAGHDVAQGLNVTQGQAQFTNAGRLVDEFGVRKHHRQLLRGMQVLLEVRDGSQHGLTVADYEVCLRYAGAAVDYQATKSFWSAMPGNGLQESRSAKTWTEFIKSRFMTEPTYYQFDRSRVAVMARDLYSNHSPLPMATLKRMDRMRLSINALKKEPWNRRKDEVDEDMRRLFRRRIDFRGYKGHWIRALYYGHEVDEELMCTSLIAFARSSSLHSMKTLIFKNYYDITIDEETDPGNTHISGGAELPANSPIKPTSRLLNAIVEAFGSISHIPLGMKLVDFVSRRYNIPIPHETWSNLLNWTYLCASKPFKPMRRLHGDFISTVTTTADVREVWNVMTSEPYHVAPKFDDYDIYIKTLLAQRSFGQALALIRSHILPFYQDVIDDYEIAVQDEILQNDLGPCPQATHRRNQAELYKDYIHHRISSWFDKLLKTASSNKGHRDGAVMKTMIPNLLIEFGDFFPHQIRYRTAQGVVQMDRPEATRRFTWTKQWRETLPQKKAGIHVRDIEGSDQPDFDYPQIPVIKVLEWQRRPKPRMTRFGKAPKDAEARRWWDRLEEELML
ncbi:hypothetical protein QQS21_009761 [Conoideocrella luteorostrata]|uniref:Mitochondrial ATPase expression-domain-containing protein n=1 Tax=Conoideocrella luteorostrata TaxID=1105319 RepID=A0AAJ0CGF5_9HYPO|nr:hypothetical protein QQS21_009761 [Conoideocrella luteorostrata]